jgi:hypothetical protein
MRNNNKDNHTQPNKSASSKNVTKSQTLKIQNPKIHLQNPLKKSLRKIPLTKIIDDPPNMPKKAAWTTPPKTAHKTRLQTDHNPR